jgi:hypothetical protein
MWKLLQSSARQNLLKSVIVRLKKLSIIPYCVLCGLTAFFGALLIIGSAVMFGVDLESQMPEYPVNIDFTFNHVLVIGVVWPAIETVILITFLNILFKSRLSKHQCCIISAVLWGFLHGLFAPIKFLTALWTFYIFSISYCLWKKHGNKKAFIAAALPHIILNISSLALMLL